MMNFPFNTARVQRKCPNWSKQQNTNNSRDTRLNKGRHVDKYNFFGQLVSFGGKIYRDPVWEEGDEEDEGQVQVVVQLGLLRTFHTFWWLYMLGHMIASAWYENINILFADFKYCIDNRRINLYVLHG